MYELGLAAPPADPDQRAKAVELAAAAFEQAGWRSPRSIQCPVPGRRGAIEHLLHLRRARSVKYYDPGTVREQTTWEQT